MLVVGERQPLAVGRPERCIEEAACEMRQDALGAAFGRSHRELLLAGDVGGVGDGLAVRRPARVVLVGVRGLGQVAGVAVLGRQREQVATRREHRAVAVGRDVVIGGLRAVLLADRALCVHPARTGARAVVRHRDVEIVQLLGRQIEHVQRTALLEHDARRAVGAAAEAREIDVVVAIMRDLAEGAGGEVVSPDVAPPAGIVIGEKVDRLAVPHGRGLGARPVGDVLELAGFEVIDVDVLPEAAVIALPGAEVAEDARVGDLLAVGAEAHEAAAVERHRFRQPAGERHAERPREPRVPGGASRQEHDALRIRRPGVHHVVRAQAQRRVGHGVRGEGQASGRPTACRDHVHVAIALVLAGEGDPLTVGREARHHILARVCRQA